MSRRILIAGTALAVALAVAACGTSTTSPSPSAAPSSAPSASAAASADPVASAAPSALPTFTRVADLEALLPTSVNGTKLQVVSLTGSDVITGGIESNQSDLATLLVQLGRQPADLQFAFAADPTRQLPLMIGVYRVDGAEAAVVESTIVDLILASDPTAKKTTETLGGKEVVLIERAVPSASPEAGASPSPATSDFEAFYVSGDTLFRVSGLTRNYVADGLLTIR
jgi:hypothetical protein